MTISDTPYDIAIVGAGITGSALAAILSTTPTLKIALIDRNIRALPGSTGHAPGFVGIYNQLPALTELAKRSLEHYASIPGGFSNVGGLEIDGDSNRAAQAQSSGLDASVLSGEEARLKAPLLVKEASSGVFFSQDGVADARKIAHTFQDRAEAAGVNFLTGNVTSYAHSASGYSVAIEGVGMGNVAAKHVVICTNVWSGELVPDIPAVPVAHPYAYSKAHGGVQEMPFVRWPSAHVYARDHGGRYGFGSYDHEPVEMAARASAYGAWGEELGEPLEKGRGFMPPAAAALFDGLAGVDGESGELGHGQEEGRGPADVLTDKAYAFNGLFCVTPDGLPLAGRIEGEGGEGVWCILGSWVTHAAGNAGVVAGMLREALGVGIEEEVREGRVGDKELREALDPLRFESEITKARVAALRSYNDIYNNDQK